MKTLSLFSGIGGLDLGLRLAVPRSRCLAYVEQDDYCGRVLRARMKEGYLDQAPVFRDVRDFDGKPWQGTVDLIHGGFPCQDISNAGKRAGMAGARSGLWSEFARIIGEVGPALVFVENVAALVNRGLDIVLGSLADLGFDAEWGVFSAAEAGATHLRRRVFILAHANEDLRERITGVGTGPRNAESGRARGRTSGCGVLLGHPVGPGLALGESVGGDDGEECPAAERAGLPLFPPGPADTCGWERVLTGRPDLAPAQRGVRGVADGTAGRVQRLRALGNAVVPVQAALAYRTLAARAGLN